eukprot:6402614-Prymnesium_polylepis.1
MPIRPLRQRHVERHQPRHRSERGGADTAPARLQGRRQRRRRPPASRGTAIVTHARAKRRSHELVSRPR